MSPFLRALVAAVFGLGSGALCSVLLSSEKEVLYALGLVFGVAAALAAGLFWKPGVWRTALVVIVIAAAWPLAHYLTIMAFDPIGGTLGKENEVFAIRVAMQVGNVVGGGLTILALAVAARVWPGPVTVLPTLAMGAAVTVVAVVPRADGVHGDILPYILFPAWQAGVMVFAVLGLGWRRRDHGLE